MKGKNKRWMASSVTTALLSPLELYGSIPYMMVLVNLSMEQPVSLFQLSHVRRWEYLDICIPK